MILETIPVGPLQCNCYILGCEQSREALLIDPGEDADLILPVLEKHQLKVKYILTTHAHIDHVGDLEAVRSKTGAEALLHEKDLVLYQNLPIQAAWLGVATPPTIKIDNYIHDQGSAPLRPAHGRNPFHTGPHPGQRLFISCPNKRESCLQEIPFSSTASAEQISGVALTNPSFNLFMKSCCH